MDKASYVYILASETYGTLYVGVTSDLLKRIAEHRLGMADGFTRKHGVKRLVWYEVYCDVTVAITREKRIKKWNRDWKINLIQTMNPNWKDLYQDIAG
jgi:putative endonuclease